MNYSRRNVLDHALSEVLRTTLSLGIASGNDLDWWFVCSLVELEEMFKKWGVQ